MVQVRGPFERPLEPYVSGRKDGRRIFFDSALCDRPHKIGASELLRSVQEWPEPLASSAQKPFESGTTG